MLDADAFPLWRKLAVLRERRTYTEDTSAVEVIETHLSWVFLTDAYAYKLKKPARHDGHDFRSVRTRRRCCDEEVRLNRRLAPDVYLAVIPLVRASDDQLSLGGAGEPVDWLVQMRRLPAASMLDAMLRKRTVTGAQLQAIARRLARFHSAQPRAALSARRYRAGLLRELLACRRVLCDPRWRLPRVRIEALVSALIMQLRTQADHFEARLAAGRVVEGHGDLRPEHVCLAQDPPVIIDCLEFSARLRTQDVADEIGFLALECERMHAPFAARALIDAYRQASGDPLPADVLHFHQSCRACVRARLCISHLQDPACATPSRWRYRTLRYLALAQRHLQAVGLIDQPTDP